MKLDYECVYGPQSYERTLTSLNSVRGRIESLEYRRSVLEKMKETMNGNEEKLTEVIDEIDNQLGEFKKMLAHLLKTADKAFEDLNNILGKKTLQMIDVEHGFKCPFCENGSMVYDDHNAFVCDKCSYEAVIVKPLSLIFNTKPNNE